MSQMNLRSTIDTKMNSASSYSLEERLNFLRTKCRQLELEIKTNQEKKKNKKKKKKKMANNLEYSLGKLLSKSRRSIRIMVDGDCEELIISVVDDSDNLSQDSSTLNISNRNEIEEILIEDKSELEPKSIVSSHFPNLAQSGESTIDDAMSVSIGSKMAAPGPEPTSTIFVQNFCRPQPRPPTFYYSQPNYNFQPPTPQPQQMFDNLWQPPTTNFPINSEPPFSLYPPMMIPPNCQQCPQFPMEISSKFEQTGSQIPTFILTSSQILEQQQQQQQLQNQFVMQNSSMIVESQTQQNPIAYHDNNNDDPGQDPSQFSEFCQPSTSAILNSNQSTTTPRKGRQSKMFQKVPKQEEQFPEETRTTRRSRRRMGHLLNETPEQRQRRLARMREYSRLRREIKNAGNSGILSISDSIRKENGTFCCPPFSKLKQESAQVEVDTKPVAKRSKYRRCGKFFNETPENRQRRLNQMKEYYRKRKMLRVGGK